MTPSVGQDAGPGEADAGLRDILIIGSERRSLEGGSNITPVDFSTMALGVQIELPDGGWRQLAATSLDAGLSTITDVPPGRTYLTYGPDIFVDTASPVIDLSYSALGRADVQYASSTTPVTLNFTGLEPWGSYGYFGVTSTNAGIFRESVLASTTSIPQGSTSGSGTFDWTTRYPLIDASRGDVTIITQHAPRTVDGVLYRAISRAATINSLTLQSGQVSSVSVAMMPLAPTSSLAIDWRTPDWEALAPQTGAGATFSKQLLSVHSTPGSSTALVMSPGLVFLGALPSRAPIQGMVSWGNPFPPAWLVVVYQRAFYEHRIAAFGLEAVWVDMAFDATELGPASGTLQPRLTPPGAVLINGEDANANLVGVGLTPTVSWTAPSLGIGPRYHLVLIQATASAGQLQLRGVSQLVTKATTVRLPPGFIPPGSTCVLWVGAENWGDNDLERKPFDVALPARSIGTMTQPFSP